MHVSIINYLSFWCFEIDIFVPINSNVWLGNMLHLSESTFQLDSLAIVPFCSIDPSRSEASFLFSFPSQLRDYCTTLVPDLWTKLWLNSDPSVRTIVWSYSMRKYDKEWFKRVQLSRTLLKFLCQGYRLPKDHRI